MLRTYTSVLVLSWVLAAALIAGRPGVPVSISAAAPQAGDRVAPGGGYHGLAIQVDGAERAVSRYGQLVREVAQLGANSVMFSVNAYQEHAGSRWVGIDPRRTPTDGQWERLFEVAHRQGLKIILMPKILLSRPRGNEWRGVIDPGQHWESWFESYRRFILHYARLAQACDVDVFVVGSELVSTEKFTQRWKELIADVRKVYSRGSVTYSANWDHYASIRFWGDLDLVGMTGYHQTARTPAPPLEQLLRSWARTRLQIEAWCRDIGKSLLFTEVGWCSQEGCSVEPWNYYRDPRPTPAGLEEQRRNYTAFVRSWQDCPVLAGSIWWEWSADGGSLDTGYSPKNKPAALVLKGWFERQEGGGTAPR